MNACALRVYRHSGRFTPQGIVLPLLAAAVLGFPLGLLYAYLLRWIPFVYINVLATFGYGLVFGWLTLRLLKSGRVRNTAIAIAVGTLAGLIAVYSEWSGHLHALLKDPPLVFRPDQILTGMAFLYKNGSWGLHGGDSVTGIPLAIVWLVEAGIIIGMAVLLPLGFVRDTPYCEESRCWLDEEKVINSLGTVSNPGHLAALKAGDIAPLVEMTPKTEGANNFTRLVMKRSPQCERFCTIRVQDVSLSLDKEGNVKEKKRNLTDLLVLPASMFELIAQFAEVEPVKA
jgi:hypothetical protein